MKPLDVVEAEDGTVLGTVGRSVEVGPVADWRTPGHGAGPVRRTEPMAARVRIELALAAGTPYWLIPGLFYGDNRDPACTRIYPRYAAGEHDRATLVADHWAFRADRAATPVVFGWGQDAGVALRSTPVRLSA